MKAFGYLAAGGAIMIALHAVGFAWLTSLGFTGTAIVFTNVITIGVLFWGIAEITSGANGTAVLTAIFPTVGWWAAFEMRPEDIGVGGQRTGAGMFSTLFLYLIVFYVFAFKDSLAWGITWAMVAMLMQIAIGECIPPQAAETAST
ncbi:MAG TPA: hypothetical protein VHB93_01750 [Candidatus Paceibacterota bacterium]|nr:hypothetical protein [Candidatus Paceibacterota bacterium]